MGKIWRKCRGKSELSKDSHRIDTASKLFVLPLLSTLVEPCCCRRTCWSLIYAIASCCCCCCCWPSCPCLCVPKDFRGLTFDPITMPGTRHQSRLPPIDHRPSTIHIPVSLSTLFFIWPHWQRLVYDNFLWLIVFDYTCRCRANNNNKISQWRQHQCRYLSILVYGYLWVSYCSCASSTRFPFL